MGLLFNLLYDFLVMLLCYFYANLMAVVVKCQLSCYFWLCCCFLQKTVRETCELIAEFFERLYHGHFEGDEQAMLVSLLLICQFIVL